MATRVLGLLPLLSLPLLVACQGRVAPDWSELEVEQQEPEAESPDVDEECPAGVRGCLAPGQTAPGVALGPQEDKDDVRGGAIGSQPGVASPAPQAEELVEAGCSGDVFEEIRSPQPGVELHVLSIHDAGPEGEVRVFVERQAAVSLVLSSFEATHWVVEFAPGARVTEVVLNGNGDQTLEIADFVSVVELEGEQSLGAFGTGSQTEKDRHATAELMRGAEEATGLSLRSFHGCATGTSFSLHGEEAF